MVIGWGWWVSNIYVVYTYIKNQTYKNPYKYAIGVFFQAKTIFSFCLEKKRTRKFDSNMNSQKPKYLFIEKIDYVLVACGYTYRLLEKNRIHKINETCRDHKNSGVVLVSYDSLHSYRGGPAKFKLIDGNKKDLNFLQALTLKYKIERDYVAFPYANNLSQAFAYAKCVDAVDFCGCFDPTSPCKMQYIEEDNKKVLVMYYDTESG